jgi:hypothetical protein
MTYDDQPDDDTLDLTPFIEFDFSLAGIPAWWDHLRDYPSAPQQPRLDWHANTRRMPPMRVIFDREFARNHHRLPSWNVLQDAAERAARAEGLEPDVARKRMVNAVYGFVRGYDLELRLNRLIPPYTNDGEMRFYVESTPELDMEQGIDLRLEYYNPPLTDATSPRPIARLDLALVYNSATSFANASRKAHKAALTTRTLTLDPITMVRVGPFELHPEWHLLAIVRALRTQAPGDYLLERILLGKHRSCSRTEGGERGV